MSLQSTCALDRASLPGEATTASFTVVPARKLSGHGLMLVHAGLALGTIVVQLAALAHGLWFVAALAGLVSCGLIAAVHASQLSREQRREQIFVTRSEVVIRRHAFCREVREVRLPLDGLSFTRWQDRSGCRLLRLNAPHLSTEVGRDLTPVERAGFAGALTAALRASGTLISVEVRRPRLLFLQRA